MNVVSGRTMFVPEMFHGPPGFERLIATLRPWPRQVSVGVLATFALADGIARRGRFRAAAEWAGAQGAEGWRRRRLAAQMLINHGRFVAGEALLGVGDISELALNVRVDGRQHLDGHRGVLLLGFHLGPPKIWLALRALGLPVIFAGNLAALRHDARWQHAMAAGAAIDLSGSIEARTAALYRIQKEVRGGALCYLTADGPFGREAFSIDLPGRAMVVRSGWLALRRTTGAPVIPVLSYEAAGRRHIAFHPALPPLDVDPERDANACATALRPVITDYVRRFPAQCRWLAFEGLSVEG